MKIATEVAVLASPDRIWNCLIDFAAYPEWNRFLKSVTGQAAPDAALNVDLQYYGKPVEKKTGQVTGFIPPKYFSWAWKHKFGAWFLAAEHVFRIKETESGKVILFQEMYYTGLGLKFRRREVEHMVKLSLEKLNDDLRHRLEAPVDAPK
ncbi:MAG: Activator of Hsp90 ATPase 1 family protein [Fibrobacteres bacterium]|nr:Activator of Hsp90 ATPase 1 family protein [Fibrobacterota bacterium]